jgi:hypothetical protein
MRRRISAPAAAPLLSAGALVLLAALLQPAAILVDKVAATVDGEVVTIHDIERAIALLPLSRRDDEREEDFYMRVLNELVTTKAVALEFGDEFTLGEEDFAVVQTQVLKKAGSMEKLMAALAGFAMSWSDLKDFLRERVIYEKALREKFTMELAVPFAEIEDFYNREYLPSQVRLGVEPLSLAEMAPQIESYLRQRSVEQRQAAWLADIRSASTIEIKLRSRQ